MSDSDVDSILNELDEATTGLHSAAQGMLAFLEEMAARQAVKRYEAEFGRLP